MNNNIIKLEIDEYLRDILLPSEGLFLGVHGDIEVNKILFLFPKYYNSIDMTEFTPIVNYVNANGDANYYECEEVKSSNGIAFFEWNITSDVTSHIGNVVFSVRLIKYDNLKIMKEFNTKPSTGTVLEDLNVDDHVTPEIQETLLEKLEKKLDLHIKEKLSDFDDHMTNAKSDSIKSINDTATSILSDISQANQESQSYNASTKVFKENAETASSEAIKAKNEAVKAAESIKNTKVPTKTSELDNDIHFLKADTEISWGRKTGTKTGARSIALGTDVEASGDGSFAEGQQTKAIGQGAHAEGGAGTTASDKYAHAEGYGTTASAQAAHSEGYNTYATGKYSHVEGYNSKATADMAHAENYGTEASGKNSHAEGLISTAKGNGSHAEGFGTVASANYQHVQGRYNVEDTENKYAHIIGGGTGNYDKKNIHTVDWSGNAEYAGDVTATIEGKKITMSSLADVILQSGAAAHNAIYCGKYLGDAVTAEQAAAIADGSFEDLFIGDYWTMGGVNYRIADFDYWYHTGFPEASRVEKHHAVIVPDTTLATGQMNGSNTTSGGYRNSLMKSTMNDTISALPPEIRSRLLVHNALLDGAWTEISVDPMNEIMVYGCYILADNSNKQTSENRQLSLFRMSPQARYAGGNYWLRNYANAAEFTLVSYYGDASKDAATSTYGIRPVFAIT